jgi:beta-mannosidase
MWRPDEFSPKEAKITLKLSDFFGKVFMNKSNLIEIKANQASIYQCINMNEIKQLGSLDEVFLAVQIQDLDGIILAENTIYFAAPKDSKLPTPNVDYRVRETESEFILELETNALVKNLYVSSELNNNFSNNYFDLLPGQPQIISIPKDASGDLNSFKSSIVIRTLIDSY